MATTNLNVRVDESLKKRAEELLNNLGMNMSTAVNVFLRQVVRVHGIPFEIKADVPNAGTMAAIEDVRNGKNLSPAFSSVEALMEDLNTED